MRSSRNVVPLTPEEQAALDIITSNNALIKIVPDYSHKVDNKVIIDYSNIDFNLNQIADPTTYRPSRSAYYYSGANIALPEIVLKTNPKTGKVHQHRPGQCVNTHNKGLEFTHTKKTSTSLLPTEPQYMDTIGQDLIGFGWDLRDCNIKNGKYVWATDAYTSINWYSPPPHAYSTPDSLPPISSIEEIRSINNKAVENQQTINHNEILAGLPKGKCSFMFCSGDSLDLRLRLSDAMLYTKAKLKLEHEIPLFIIKPDYQDGAGNEFRVYTAEERALDLKTRELNLSQNTTHALAKVGLFSRNPSIEAAYPTTDLQTSLLKGFI
jgi:hypothetical protein